MQIGGGWQEVRFRLPHAAWQAGSNTFELHSATADRPVDVGLADDPRHMSRVVKRVEVR